MPIYFILDGTFRRFRNSGITLPFLILFLCFMQWSCGNEENYGDTPADLTKIMIPSKANTTYENIFDSTVFVPLETNSLCFIKKIDYIDSLNKSIYILDVASKQILRFGFDGKFLSKYSKIGSSESELSTPMDFSILHARGEICVYDSGNDKLVYFDGFLNFLREKKVPFRFKKFSIDNGEDNYTFDKEYGFENKREMKYQIIRTDSNFNIISKQIHYKTGLGFFLAGADGNGNLTKDYNKNLFLPFYSSTVFEINTKGECNAKYVIDFEKGKLLDEKAAEKLTALNYSNVIQDTNNITGLAITNNQENIFGFFRIAEDFFHFTYNFNTPVVKLIQAKTNPSCGCGPIYTFKKFFGPSLVGYVTAANFEGFVKELNGKEQDDSTKKVLQKFNVSPSNNPVLVFSKLRNSHVVLK
ncbi:MAG: 6-bladed beta-propeller [Niabella sp.]